MTMKPKINCNECWYYIDQPWPTCEKAWCRMQEGKIMELKSED